MEKKEEVGSVGTSNGVLRVVLLNGVIYQPLGGGGYFEYEEDGKSATIYSPYMFSSDHCQSNAKAIYNRPKEA